MGDPAPEIREWVLAVRRVLDLDGLAEADLDRVVDSVLDLTAAVAHGVSRPAAPVTAFLVGLAAGRAADPAAALPSHLDTVGALAATWPVS